MAAHQASCAHGRALPAPFGKRSLLAHLSARWVCTRWRRARVLDTERRQGRWLAVQERRAALRAQMRCTTSTGQRHPERAARPAWRRACSCATRLADRAQRPGCHLAAGCSALPWWLSAALQASRPGGTSCAGRLRASLEAAERAGRLRRRAAGGRAGAGARLLGDSWRPRSGALP